MIDDDVARPPLTEEGLRDLLAHPPEGWFRLTVRLEDHAGARFHEVKALIGLGELRERPLAELATSYLLPAILGVTGRAPGADPPKDAA
jgi:hypothetical protein